MLDEVIFNYQMYKFRMEDDDRMLLYQPRTGKMFFVKGNTRKMLYQIIKETNGVKVNTDNKYISYFLTQNILLRRLDSNDRCK